MAMETTTQGEMLTTFRTEFLDTGRIHDELTHLWARLGGPPKGGDGTSEIIAEPHFGGGGLMRTNTLNLIAVARDPDEAAQIAEHVSLLRDFLPSRAIILRDHDGEPSEAPFFDVRVELMEQQRKDGKPGLRFEAITIAAHRHEMGELASLVSPLFVAELPDFLWWPGGDFARNGLFEDLLELVDRVIVDSARIGHDASGVSAMKDLLHDDDEDAGPPLGDFSWLRLAPWRQLLAQFFDPPEVQHSLATIEQVTISYADTQADGSSGFASALLTVGWLASRLGWEPVDALERRKGGGWSAPLSANDGGRKRDVSLRLIPVKGDQPHDALTEVKLFAGGDAPGTFQVERTDETNLMTSSESRSVPLVSRIVYASPPSDDHMLGEELQRFGSDRVFEEALRFATRLLP